MELRFKWNLQLLDQLGARFLDVCNIMGRFQNRTWGKIFLPQVRFRKWCVLLINATKSGSKKAPKVVISSGNVSPSRYFLKLFESVTETERRFRPRARHGAHTTHTSDTHGEQKMFPSHFPFGRPAVTPSLQLNCLSSFHTVPFPTPPPDFGRSESTTSV